MTRQIHISNDDLSHCQAWARVLAEGCDHASLARMNAAAMRAFASRMLTPLWPTPTEIEAVTLALCAIARDNALPANAPPPQRGSRMFRTG